MGASGLQGGADLNALTERIIRCAILVHLGVGPGLFENVYEELLCFELQEAGIPFERQKRMPVHYRGKVLDFGYKADLVVDNRVILELKCVKEVLPVHEAQLLGYLKLSGLEVGLLFNFHEVLLKDGLRRKFNTNRQPVPGKG